MLRILGSPKNLCGGMTRRDWLRIGGLGLAGLTLPDVLKLQQAAAGEAKERDPGFGRAKAIILIHLYGSPSQLEWVDPKPDAPVEIRGEFGVIPSSLPGCYVCELFPNMAKVMDRTTVIRSLTHPYPLHGVAYALTGVPQIDVPMELNPRDPRHWPFIGSVVDYVGRRKAGRKPPPVPNNIALPFPFSTRRVGEVARAGPYAAFLGGAYNPIWTEFHGQATRHMLKTLQEQKLDVAEPYMGITPGSRFELATATELPRDITLDRLDTRRSLAEQFDQARRDLPATDAGRSAATVPLAAVADLVPESVRSEPISWLYDELDLGANAGRRTRAFRHRILLSDGREVDLHFRKVTVKKPIPVVPASPLLATPSQLSVGSAGTTSGRHSA